MQLELPDVCPKELALGRELIFCICSCCSKNNLIRSFSSAEVEDKYLASPVPGPGRSVSAVLRIPKPTAEVSDGATELRDANGNVTVE